VNFSDTSHVYFLVIKTYKVDEQTGSHTPKPHGKSTAAVPIHALRFDVSATLMSDVVSGRGRFE
jgi:hypothetical protein